MAADRSQSPAYQALTPAARKVLAVIEGKIADGGGVATISLTNLAKLCGVSNSTAFLAQRQIVALGFVSIAPGPRPRDSYRLADGWRAHDAVEVMRLRKVARRRSRERRSRSNPAPSAVAAAYAVGRCAVVVRPFAAALTHAQKKAPNTEKPSGPYREVRIVLPPRRHGSKSECTAHVVCVLTWIKPCGGGRSGQRYCPDDAGDRQR